MIVGWGLLNSSWRFLKLSISSWEIGDINKFLKSCSYCFIRLIKWGVWVFILFKIELIFSGLSLHKILIILAFFFKSSGKLGLIGPGT